ncbi:histone deacetylase complex subunit SAP130 [Hyposmocoma kahamanoa]|uniref:histone deacetylase complex subunit SAP130 n=1 Tax=Hyposmocoma kahamanoa TaxID=1477025 RepID=UPI000E6D87F3|nr:histone deacetylase complex subunit SAP130 [Hyposmocoma kahamanoa]
MSSNVENDRSITAGKMYPIDLAPQKITIVKSVSNAEVKMAHLIPGQPKTTAAGQLITHPGPVGLLRPTAQILSPGVSSQPQMIVTGSPLLQGTQIVSQGSQIIGQSSQIISPGGQILSPGTQIISQGTQLTAVSSTSNTGSSNVQVSVPSSVSGQVLSVGGLVSAGPAQLVSGAANLVVSSSVRTLPPSVRVLPPLPHHNNRPATAVLSTVNVSSAGGVLVSKGVTSHVPRGLAAGASLAVRPVAPAASAISGGAWSSGRGRGALVYGARTPLTRAAPPRAPSAPPAPTSTPSPAPSPACAAGPTATITVTQASHSAMVTLPTTTVLTSTGVISGTLRAATPAPRPTTPTPAAVTPRPLPLLQRNYQPKVVGVASVGVRGVVGNSAPAQLYYEVPRAQLNTQHPQHTVPHTQATGHSRPLTPFAHAQPAQAMEERYLLTLTLDKLNRRLSNEVRQCQEFQTEEPPPTPPSVEVKPPKRPLLSSSYVCGWRGTAMHFTRPSDVRRREPRAKDILQIASQKHVLTSAEGWKVHHLTAQMDDLVSLEADVGAQLSTLLKQLENLGSRAQTALQPHTHTLLELLKGNIQRSKIVCEGIHEARDDLLRVFTHRTFVSDILTRQADKRCFRKHRSQS